MRSQQVATLPAGGFRRVRLFRTVIARGFRVVPHTAVARERDPPQQAAKMAAFPVSVAKMATFHTAATSVAVVYISLQIFYNLPCSANQMKMIIFWSQGQ